MPTDIETISLALALTTGGAGIIAGIITGIVEIFSRSVAAVRGHEQGLALALSAIVIIAAIAEAISQAALTLSASTIFFGVVAWYGLARISMGIHDDLLDRNSTTSLGTNV